MNGDNPNEYEVNVSDLKCEALRRILSLVEAYDALIPSVRSFYKVYAALAPMGSQSSVARDVDNKLDDIQKMTNAVERDIKTLLFSLGCSRSQF